MSEKLVLKSSVAALALIASVVATTPWAHTYITTIYGQPFSFLAPADFLWYGAPVLFFSVITLFLRARIFLPWLVLTVLWLPVSIFGMLQSSGDTGLFGGSERAYVVILSWVIYITVSVSIILAQSVRVYWLKNLKTWMVFLLSAVVCVAILGALFWGVQTGVLHT